MCDGTCGLLLVMNDPYPSSDDRRSGDRLKHLQKAVFAEALPLALGGELPGVACGYETWGTLNAEASNAVMVCHAISGDSHAARHDGASGGDDPGWWDELIGPGADYAIDTERIFVVCSNVLGGCRGTTGPGTSNAETGEPYGADFPPITVADMVAVQTRLADHLGVTKWRAVVGGSLGGHQALTWATLHPERVQTCIAIATSPRLTSQALAFDVIARTAIQTDPHFHGGQYYGQPTQPDTGLAIARMLGHITYLSSEAMDAKFVYAILPKEGDIQSIIERQAHKKAKALVSRVSTHMALEKQALGEKKNQAEIKRLTDELLHNPPSGFWEEE